MPWRLFNKDNDKDELINFECLLVFKTGDMSSLSAKDLMNDVAATIPAKWRVFGIQLNVSSNELDRIWDENPQDCQGSFQKMLDHWKKTSTSPYTWRTIIDALKAPAVGEVARANYLETKYISNKDISQKVSRCTCRTINTHIQVCVPTVHSGPCANAFHI